MGVYLYLANRSATQLSEVGVFVGHNRKGCWVTLLRRFTQPTAGDLRSNAAYDGVPLRFASGIINTGEIGVLL